MIPFLDTALKAVHKQSYDDAVDRLSYYYSTLILLFLSILTTAKQYVGKPIQCWVPAQFKGGWEQYAENYCFIQNTYYVPFDKGLPRDIVERDYRKIGYYQWVPIILAIQALLLYLPNSFWKILNWQSGINVKAILKMASSAEVVEEGQRRKMVKILARYVLYSLHVERTSARMIKPSSPFVRRRAVGRGITSNFGKKSNSYLTRLYMLTKFLYVLNVVGQFFLLNAFLGTEYKFWGWQILVDLVNGREWNISGHFPRVTYCDFSVREMGDNIHNHSVQCVLMINMFNEKIFIFLWFWMLLVACCTLVNLLYWLLFYLPDKRRRSFVHKHLQVTGAAPCSAPFGKFTWQHFAVEQLKMDGALLLRFISTHVGDLVAAELTTALFDDYKAHLKSDRSEKVKMAEKIGNGLDHPDLAFGFQECLNAEEEVKEPSSNGGSYAANLNNSSENGKESSSSGYPGPPKLSHFP